MPVSVAVAMPDAAVRRLVWVKRSTLSLTTRVPAGAEAARIGVERLAPAGTAASRTSSRAVTRTAGRWRKTASDMGCGGGRVPASEAPQAGAAPRVFAGPPGTSAGLLDQQVTTRWNARLAGGVGAVPSAPPPARVSTRTVLASTPSAEAAPVLSDVPCSVT